MIGTMMKNIVTNHLGTVAVQSNVAQTCPWVDHLGNPHTVTIPAGTFHASGGVSPAASQIIADNMAKDACTEEANRLQAEDAEPSQTQVGP